MADEPEGPEDEPVETADDGEAAEAEVSVLAELALCENLSQTSGWAARWSATMAGADATLLWAPDTLHPLFLCIGASGEGVDRLDDSGNAGGDDHFLIDHQVRGVGLIFALSRAGRAGAEQQAH